MTQTAEARDGSTIIQITGDRNNVNIQGQAHLTLTTRLRSRSRPPQKDLDLLIPESCAIPLIGRDHDQAALRRWLSTDRPISILAITGGGGSGKTRLALEMILEFAQDPGASWDAGFVTQTELHRFIDKQNLGTWGWQQNTLIVLDYAASLGTDLRTWLTELADRTVQQTPKLRLPLLERHADTASGWYANLLSGDSQTENVRDLFDPWEPIQIRPIAETSFRREILSSTLQKAAALRSVPVPALPAPREDQRFDQRLEGAQWSDPLMLMMAALRALDTGVPTALSLSRPEIARRLAQREVARLRRFASKNEDAANFLVHLAACVTLCGGLKQSQALPLAAEESSALGLQYPNGYGAAVRCLREALPAPDGIDAIRPDLIGEAFLVEAWKTANPAGSIARALSVAENNVLSTLIRTAQDFADGKERRPLAWLNTLVSETNDYRFLEVFSYAIPLETLCLRELALKLASKLLDIRTKVPDIDRANLLLNLSNRQSLLGQREQAVASIEEAVRLYRELAATPDAHRPALANSLNSLSNCESALGQRERALLSIGEAVVLYRELVGARPDVFRPELARALNNLSNCQSELGQPDRALLAIEEAIVFYRELAVSHPDSFRPDLGLVLNTLSDRQSGAGQREQALLAIEEAVTLYRDLAATRPDAFRPDLARSLNNLSKCQSELGKPEQALVAIEEAIHIRRELVAGHSDAFRPDLASSLHNLSAYQSVLGQRQQALASIEEAVRLHRELAVSHPDAFCPHLARSLDTLSNCQSALGQRKRCLVSIEEAVLLHRKLAASRPDAFRPDLARSLNNRSNHQIAFGQREQALVSIEEAVSIYRLLVLARPDAFRPDLARSLHTLSICQGTLGQREQALLSIEEAVRIRRELVATRPDAFRADLARSLSNLSNHQSDLARHEQALNSIQEAVRIFRELAAATPDAFVSNLATSVFVLGRCYSALGDLKGSLSAATEALALLRPAFLAYPDAFSSLAASLIKDYATRSQGLNLDPDPILLQPYLEYFNQFNSPETHP